MPELFDQPTKALRRDRAAALGTATFLFDRAFDDCLERLALVRRPFARALLAGCPNPEWPARVPARSLDIIDPSPRMALAAGGKRGDLECPGFGPESFDLILSIGLLDNANHLELAARAMLLMLRPGGLLMGAIAGGESLRRLRMAMLAADSASGAATPHIHPRIEAANLGQLLASCGFLDPVVDVDRVHLSYKSLDALVGDLRAMGATNVLQARSRSPISRSAVAAARAEFIADAERAQEQIDIIHFAAWKAPAAT